ncbi:AP-3 complex subunit mu-like [Dorcoceras hygrometricum]|uniref:AP-3 complex subunit mu-like n=1 Tax=Dorcoceras hygrometricum TaxID=472368 RepID=A0A2Z7D144_9LAMI|nr:AP-3 complex subunit mu-like [Dorcoceras hygrometricum]
MMIWAVGLQADLGRRAGLCTLNRIEPVLPKQYNCSRFVFLMKRCIYSKRYNCSRFVFLMKRCICSKRGWKMAVEASRVENVHTPKTHCLLNALCSWKVFTRDRKPYAENKCLDYTNHSRRHIFPHVFCGTRTHGESTGMVIARLDDRLFNTAAAHMIENKLRVGYTTESTSEDDEPRPIGEESVRGWEIPVGALILKCFICSFVVLASYYLMKQTCSLIW